MASESEETVRFAVRGMHCEGCVSGITRALREHDGVLGQQVSLADSSAAVTYDPKKISPADIKAVIEELGFVVV